MKNRLDKYRYVCNNSFKYQVGFQLPDRDYLWASKNAGKMSYSIDSTPYRALEYKYMIMEKREIHHYIVQMEK